jgi:hypothetical protein
MHFFRWLSWAGCQLDIGSFNYRAQNNLRGESQEVLAFAKTASSSKMQPKNYAAVIPSAKAQLTAVEVPFPECGSDELIIENHVVAVNPVDWKVS